MKRVYSAIGLCIALLVLEAAVFLPASKAKGDLVSQLLQLPAPPPYNPLARQQRSRLRDPDFYKKSSPPADNAPIDEILDYWAEQQRSLRQLNYVPDPSERTLDRLFNEIDRDPALLTKYLAAFPDSEKTADFVKGIYEHEGTTGALDKDARRTVKEWLTYHSSYFSNDLLRLAERVSDTGDYVTNQEELLALARVDFDKARPLIDRLFANPQNKAGRVLANWALYRHALDSESTSDIERYRDELKAAVEDRSLPPPTRDLAMDALVSEKDWSGRDDWYMSLLSDDTMADLQGYTGLTTLINVSPEDKYTDKMLELLKSDNKAVRTAAVRNLLSRPSGGIRPDVLRALLPWLEDPAWANDVAEARGNIVLALRTAKVPESVPGLIKMLDEKKKQRVYGGPMNTMANAPAANIAPVRAANSNSSWGGNYAPRMVDIESYAYRSAAVGALAFQSDPAAAPALRRILNETGGYEGRLVIDALIKCNGFTVPEEVDALEAAAKTRGSSPLYGSNAMSNAAFVVSNAAMAAANTMANAATYAAAGMANNAKPGFSYGTNAPYRNAGPPTPAEIKELLGFELLGSSDVSDELVAGTVSRIEALDRRDPKTAGLLRNVVLRWPNPTVNLLFLHDLKNYKADAQTAVRLLSQRKLLREQMSSDVFDAKSGSPTAYGIASCLIEDTGDYDAILAGENSETKTALLACARLIRAPLPVPKVAELTKAADRRLALAAERYLEAEDSPEARSVVLGLHPGDAKILGATTAFFAEGGLTSGGLFQYALFESVRPDSRAGAAGSPNMGPGGYYDYDGQGMPGYLPSDADALEKKEKALREEVKKDDELLGIYAYDGNYVRIYKDRAMFSWDDDDSRYRERPLTAYEFDYLKAYLSDHNVDDLAPFLQCGFAYCASRELLMLGRAGGRRVYMNGEPAAFFVGLDKIFADLKQAPATVKYALSCEIPGLELLMANDDLHAETVWKDGDDIRVAVINRSVRKKVQEEIDKAAEDADEKDPESQSEDEEPPSVVLREKLTNKRAYEGYSWRKIIGGNDAGPAAQPPQFELIPNVDAANVPADQEQWKARTQAFEIRASDDGLYKFSGGKLTKLQSEYFESPVVTPNGKWAVAYHTTGAEDDLSTLTRVNLLTNKLFPVKFDNYAEYTPVAYLPTINKFLLVEQTRDYEGDGEDVAAAEKDDIVAADPQPSEMMLLDPDTGAVQPASGEFRPLTQQTFRPLQKASKPNEFWTAIPDVDKNETLIGIFDTGHFSFKPILTLPKISFNSMSMWVDEPGNKVYFVYRGHLLSLPLKSAGH